MSRYRYGPFTGGDPLAPPVDVRSAVDALGADVLEGRGAAEALRDLLRRGTAGRDGERRPGLDALRHRLAARRRELMRSGRLDGALRRAREELAAALDDERGALLGDDAPADAEERWQRLDDLPDGVGAAVRDLEDYDWVSPTAEARYAGIRDRLRDEVLRQRLGPLAGRRGGEHGDEGDGPAGPSPDVGGLVDMLADLNALLAKHARGEDTTDAFAEFMDRHGEAFGDDPAARPKDVDELVDELARRAAAAERLMSSLSPGQRAELAQMVRAAMADPDLAAQLAALNEHLRDLRPGLDWRSSARVDGPGDLGYDEAAGALGELADLDELAAQMGQRHPGATLDDVDVEAVERQLGAGAAADVRELQRLERELLRQGWLSRSADGLALSPKALRRLGETALARVTEQLSSARRGEHDERSAGMAGEPTGSWRPWTFGDEQPLDAVRTVTNALTSALARGGPDGVAGGLAAGALGGVRLAVEDFAVVETERRGVAAVALCVDLSYSMYAEGRWGAMKQMALALQHLVATRYPSDALQVIGFDRWARRMTPAELAAAAPSGIQGTNLAGALALARAHLARHPGSAPVLLVVTDGEPTAHLDASGEAVFDWPTSPETLHATLAEVDALTRSRVPISTVVLGDDPGLRRFVDAVARRNGGRVLAPSPDRLGEVVVDDYLRARRR